MLKTKNMTETIGEITQTYFEDILTKLQELFQHYEIENAKEIRLYTQFDENLYGDSLDKVNLMIDIEDKFEIILDDEKYHESKTVYQLAQHIQEKLDIKENRK